MKFYYAILFFFSLFSLTLHNQAVGGSADQLAPPVTPTASEELKPPVVDFNTIWLSSLRVRAGDDISVSIQVTDPNPYFIGSIDYEIISPSGKKASIIYIYSDNSDADQSKVKKTYRISKYAEPGLYKIVSFKANSYQYKYEQDLNQYELTFEVLNNNLDTTPPSLDIGSIELGFIDEYRGSASFSVSISDDKSGIDADDAHFVILRPDGTKIKVKFSYNYLSTNENNDSEPPNAVYKGGISIRIDPFDTAPPLGGIYKIIGLNGIRDKAGNLMADQDLSSLDLTIKVLTTEEKESKHLAILERARETDQRKAQEQEIKTQIAAQIDVQPLTQEEKQELTKNIKTMHDLTLARADKTKSEQDPNSLPKNLALQYCVQDLENFLEQHQSELTSYISQLQKQGSTGEIDVIQNLHQQLIDLQTIKYVLLMISEAWDTSDNENHPNEVDKHETELSRVIASKYDDYIGRKGGQCFKLPEFLDQYEKLVIEQLLKTKSYREKLEKNPEITGVSHPEIIEDLRDVLVPLQSSTTTFWHGNRVAK